MEILKDKNSVVNFNPISEVVWGSFNLWKERKVTNTHACFAFLRGSINTSYKYLSFYLKSQIDTCNSGKFNFSILEMFIELLKDMGMFRNVHDYEIVQQKVYITFNLDKVSSREIYFVGNFVRLVQEQPQVVYNFITAHLRFPEKPLYELLILSHVIQFHPFNSFNYIDGHSLVGSQFDYIRQPLSDILDSYSLRPSYNQSSNYCDYRKDKAVNLDIVNSFSRKPQPCTPLAYSEELYESYLSKEKYDAWLEKQPKLKENKSW